MAKPIRLDESGYRNFGLRDMLAYGAGDFGCTMSFGLKGTLIIFLTQYMGLDTMLYALLYAIVQIWDAINDPLLGSMIDSDRRKYKLGKFRTYILVGSIGLLFAGALCFLPVPNLRLWQRTFCLSRAMCCGMPSTPWPMSLTVPCCR